MHHSNSKISTLAFLFALVVGSSTAMAQYGPWGASPYVSWGAYPSMNAAAAQRTIYTQKQAAQRQGLAQAQQRHTAQNQFLMSQSRAQSSFAASNTRAAAESFVQRQQPRQTVVYGGGRARAAAPAAALPTRLPKSDQSVKPYDKVVDWPSLLKASTFRTPRVRIETIMQKAEPGGPGLSESNYKDIVLSVNRMKNSLERMSDGLNAREYIGVVNYLDELTKRAKTAVRR